jgi:hypothetical protein
MRNSVDGLLPPSQHWQPASAPQWDPEVFANVDVHAHAPVKSGRRLETEETLSLITSENIRRIVSI